MLGGLSPPLTAQRGPVFIKSRHAAVILIQLVSETEIRQAWATTFSWHSHLFLRSVSVHVCVCECVCV